MSAWIAGLWFFSWTAASAPGVGAPGESLFQKGVRLYEQGRFEESIALFEKALNRYPEGSNILWNLGLASAAAEHHAKALTYWNRYRKVRDRDWRVIPKLIQTYQALGRLKQRDETLDELLRLRKQTRDPKLKEAVLFCREQFRVNERLVLAYQFFDPSGEWKQFYRFSVANPQGGEDFYVSLGSYDTTTQISRELGELAPGERLYHLDGYYPEKVHKTFGFMKAKTVPTYDSIRPAVIQILKGEVEPVSSSQFK